ncbi:beta strand repeat-containing protein [Psychrobacter sp. NPDC077938]|uniref:beta strand repeat-containing protein n=1 Tax=Psychrobacter sp. NPDC077938 TaxID=3364494 RepID=UPI0037CBBDDB
MKSNTFNYSLLAVGIAAVMGISGGANAATPNTTGGVSAGAAAINNVATANYSVAGIAQPNVSSNIVTVNVSETANFALTSTIDDGSIGDDIAINQTATPGGTTTFTHNLTNTGNVTDTYTINTTGNDSALVTANPDYALGTAPVTFTIVQADGTPLTSAQIAALNGQAQTGTIANGGTIKLQPGTRANLSYEAATPDARNGNDKGVGTLTATSTFFTANLPANATLVNENQTIVRLPTFKIVKTATSTVDLTVANPQINYSIVVTNATTDYSAAATDIVIRDVLPTGLSLPNGAASDVTVTGGAGTATISTINGRRAIDVAVANLAVGASRTITFTVNVDKTQYTTANSSATNNVEVYDKFVGPIGVLPAVPVLGTDYNILDSTNNNIDVTRVPAAADLANGAGIDTAGVTNFTRRAVVVSNPTTREIAPASGTANQAIHSTLITNSGQDAEGTNTNPLTFTIADGGNNAAVRPVTGPVSVTYTPPGGGAPVTITLQPTVAGGNTYTLNSSTLPTAQFPNGIAPGGTLAINYNVSSGNVTTPTTVADAAAVGSTETTIVTLTPAGTNPPAVTSVTDTTNVRGLSLVKAQSLDATCSGTVASSTFVQTAIDATPDQCVIYRIQATNTSSAALGFNLTGVTISDLLSNFSAGADLVANSPATSATTSSTAGTASTTSTAVLGTNYTIVPQGVGTLTFKIKIKNAR